MGRGAREMVLDVVNKFRCRNSGREIYKLQVLHWPTPQGKVPQGDDNSWGRLLWTRVSRIFLLCRKEIKLRGYWRKWKMFQGHFLRCENSS